MEEKKKDIPFFGCIDFYGNGKRPEGLPPVRVIKKGYKNNDPIEVKRPMRSSVYRTKPGESIDWREYYS